LAPSASAATGGAASAHIGTRVVLAFRPTRFRIRSGDAEVRSRGPLLSELEAFDRDVLDLSGGSLISVELYQIYTLSAINTAFSSGAETRSLR
jgi:hypothetical protein